jgi:hypothetical protein
MNLSHLSVLITMLLHKRAGNIYSDIGVKGSLILFGISMIIAAIVIFVLWPVFGGVCMWESDPVNNPNALCQ